MNKEGRERIHEGREEARRSPPPSSAPNTLSALSCPLTSPMRISPHLPRAPATLPPAANAPTRPDRHPHSLRAPPSPAGPARTVTSNVPHPHPHPPAHAPTPDIPHNCKQGKEEMRNGLRDRVKRWVYPSSYFAWKMRGALAVEANWRAKLDGGTADGNGGGDRKVDRRSLPARTSDFRPPSPSPSRVHPRARWGCLICMIRVRGESPRASRPLRRGRTLIKLGPGEHRRRDCARVLALHRQVVCSSAPSLRYPLTQSHDLTQAERPWAGRGACARPSKSSSRAPVSPAVTDPVPVRSHQPTLPRSTRLDSSSPPRERSAHVCVGGSRGRGRPQTVTKRQGTRVLASLADPAQSHERSSSTWQ
ncbi:hypothetical protein B0H14DRAFT_1077919 [Mycena olivaceomarginata]|nr:hypothetical protein B0H14DRAFT_1077919 [Mycena olivaceomarginata]